MSIKLRVRDLKTGNGEIVDFATEDEAQKWLRERPPFRDVMGVAGVVPIAQDLQERLKAAMRPLDADERLADKALELKIQTLELEREAESRKKDIENEAKHLEALKTADPDRPMEIQWRFHGEMKLTDAHDPREITEEARQAVLAFVAERNEWVERRGQCVGEATCKVWPGKVPPGKDRVQEGRFVPVSAGDDK